MIPISYCEPCVYSVSWYSLHMNISDSHLKLIYTHMHFYFSCSTYPRKARKIKWRLEGMNYGQATSVVKSVVQSVDVMWSGFIDWTTLRPLNLQISSQLFIKKMIYVLNVTKVTRLLKQWLINQTFCSWLYKDAREDSNHASNSPLSPLSFTPHVYAHSPSPFTTTITFHWTTKVFFYQFFLAKLTPFPSINEPLFHASIPFSPPSLLPTKVHLFLSCSSAA